MTLHAHIYFTLRSMLHVVCCTTHNHCHKHIVKYMCVMQETNIHLDHNVEAVLVIWHNKVCQGSRTAASCTTVLLNGPDQPDVSFQTASISHNFKIMPIFLMALLQKAC